MSNLSYSIIIQQQSHLIPITCENYRYRKSTYSKRIKKGCDGTIDDTKFVMTAFYKKYQSSNTCHDISIPFIILLHTAS